MRKLLVIAAIVGGLTLQGMWAPSWWQSAGMPKPAPAVVAVAGSSSPSPAAHAAGGGGGHHLLHAYVAWRVIRFMFHHRYGWRYRGFGPRIRWRW